jgi:hypothetical protein
MLENSGFSHRNFLSHAEEEVAGMAPGFMGRGGLPRLIELLQQSRPLPDGQRLIGSNKIQVDLEVTLFDGSRVRDVPTALADDFRGLGISPVEGEGTFWKDFVTAGQIQSLPPKLAEFSLVFIGAIRTMPFARALGVPEDRIIAIPDYGAFELMEQMIAQFIEITANDSRPPVVIHSAGIAGSVLCCELSSRGVTLSGIDLGLAAAIFDIEYLAPRGWFRQNAVAVLEAAKSMERLFFSDKTLRVGAFSSCNVQRLNREAQRLARWGEISRLSTSEPRKAVRLLSALVRRVRCLKTPVLESILLLWQQFYMGTVDAKLLLKCSEEEARVEPLLASATVFHIVGNRDSAWTALAKVRALSPLDFRLSSWAATLAIENNSTDLMSEWVRVLSMPGRSDLGSAISWALDGDLTSGRKKVASWEAV